MKTISKLLVLLILSSWGLGAQNEANPWQITIGINAVNVYPVGEDAPQGPFFDEFFNATDHWNILPSLSYLSLNKHIKRNISVGFAASLNRIEKWGQTVADNSVSIDELMYYGLDGAVKFSLGDLVNSSRIEPFVGLGGGYTWMEEGRYNNKPFVT